MAQSITLSSSGASAGVIILNPVFNETIMQVTVTSGSSGITFVQYTLDDLARPGTVTGTPAPSITWQALSSAINSSAADITAGGAAGQTFTVLCPLTGLRLFGSSNALAGYNTTATLKVLQSITA